jgi:hypothetical protein
MGTWCPTDFSKSWDKTALHLGTTGPNNSPMTASDSLPTSFRSIIDLWGSREAMASDVGTTNWSVIKWWKRDTIPSEWWTRILDSERAKAAGVTAELLADLAARKLEEARA